MDSLYGCSAGYIRPQKSTNPTRRTARGLFMFCYCLYYVCEGVCVCCAGVCVCVCVCSVCYMHSTSFTIFGQRAASSSLAPAMSVHISHSTLEQRPPLGLRCCRHTCSTAISLSISNAIYEKAKAKAKKKEKETQHKRKTSKSCCQSLNNVSFCCRCTWPASDSTDL